MLDLTSFGAIGDGLTNDSAALTAAIAACGAGDTILIKTGDTYLIDPGAVVPGGVKFEGSGAFKFSHQTGAHGFTCTQGDNAFVGMSFIGAGKATVYDGFAFVSIRADGVNVENVKMVDGQGTGIRVADSKNVFLRNAQIDVGSNAITLNDDLAGTNWLVVENVRATCGVIGFGAESDDADLIVSNVLIRGCRFTRTAPIAGDSYGVGLTKSSTHGAGAFKKYRNAVIEDVYVEGFTTAYPIRGADGVTLRGLVSRNCQRAITLAAGNAVDNIDITGCDLQASEHGIVSSGPTTRMTAIGNRITLNQYYGIYADGVSDAVVSNNIIRFHVAASSVGIRLTNSTGIALGNRVNNAATPYNMTGGIYFTANA